MLVTKQGPQKLVMPAQVTIQNQQELSAEVQKPGSFCIWWHTVDKNQMWGLSPNQSLLPTLAPGSNSNTPATLGTSS